MSNQKNNPSKINLTSVIAAAIFGSVVTFAATSFLGGSSSSETSTESAAKKPIYWVSPMDSNYKRDKPGKSPMGMDLIPVYADGGSGSDSGPGTIKISPDVVNNLGVRTAKVAYKTLHTQIKTVGYVKYDEDQLVHIHPRVKGWVEKLYVKAAGDPVEKDQPLYDIYSPELVNAQEEMLLAIDRKNKRLIKAAEARLLALQIPNEAVSQLKKTGRVKQRITFYSPQTGVIDNLKIREGFFVKPGTTIMSIGQLDQMWVEAEVFERQVMDVKKGLAVTMTLDYLPGREWLGKVDYIYPALDRKTRTVKVRLRFENPNHELKPNMFTQVIIHTQGKQNMVVVPREAVIRTGNINRVVLALGEGRFKSVNVGIGKIDDSLIQILSGVEIGDTVVTSAQFLLDSESSKTSDFKRMNADVSSSTNMKGMDMKGMDMKGMDMKGMDMKGMDMKGMDMKGMDMKDMDMKDMDMKDMDMKGMDMKDMDMKDMDMKDMDMNKKHDSQSSDKTNK